MKRLRTVLACLIFLIIPPEKPVKANAGPRGCDRMPAADMKNLIGVDLDAPEVRGLGGCGGVCESTTGWLCMYRIAGSEDRMYVYIYQPPFSWGDPIKAQHEMAPYSNAGILSDVAGVGTGATWQYNPEQLGGRGMFYAVDGDRLRVLAVAEGLSEPDARSGAQALAKLALSRF